MRTSRGAAAPGGGAARRAAIGARCAAAAAAAAAPARRRAATLRRRAAAQDIELPPHLAAELDEMEKSAACGTEGTVLVRPVKEGVPKNGKKYHIHTFGCQVGAPRSWRDGAAVLFSRGVQSSWL